MQDNQQPTQAAAVRSLRHDFTEKQRRHLQPLLDRGAEIQQRVAWFMNFIADESDLPKTPSGYELKFDQDGTPYMLGLVPEHPPAK